MSVILHTCGAVIREFGSPACTEYLVRFCFVFGVGIVFGMKLLESF